jgi:hypothetical protein
VAKTVPYEYGMVLFRFNKDGALKQTIAHPCVSVWSVAVLNNGDIVSAGSDGYLRIFTNVKERYANQSDINVINKFIIDFQRICSKD